MRRLFGAILQGIGWSAGKDIYKEGRKKLRAGLARLPEEKTPRQLAKQSRVAEKARRAAEKERAATAKKREKPSRTSSPR